jgi:pimeloyl-ACP methyl ester carboxylesterase
MATANINGIRLSYELSGTGEIPLVFVHGSWVSHHDWDLVVPGFAESFQILTHDRRGHSDSERPTKPSSIRDDVNDLASLIENLGLAPAWVVGNSFGGSITLRLAGQRPDLFRGLIVHEPPLFSLLSDDPHWAPLLEEARLKLAAVAELITSGNHAGAAELFIESVVLGPGSWPKVPIRIKSIVIENAPTFLDEVNDSEQLAFDRERIRISRVRCSSPAVQRALRHSPRWWQSSPKYCPR